MPTCLDLKVGLDKDIKRLKELDGEYRGLNLKKKLTKKEKERQLKLGRFFNCGTNINTYRQNKGEEMGKVREYSGDGFPIYMATNVCEGNKFYLT